MSPSASSRQRAIRSNPSVVPLATATHRHFDESSSRSLGSVPRSTAARTEPGNLTLLVVAGAEFGLVAVHAVGQHRARIPHLVAGLLGRFGWQARPFPLHALAAGQLRVGPGAGTRVGLP